ncbi:hypothetical protein AB4037_23100 [Labrys sp. KB_33_2]|uniref:hypothetical protein n=1 Tax=Labrys sp. KB_33_2 TaxID=3237479 RepID=UPI003F8E0911
MASIKINLTASDRVQTAVSFACRKVEGLSSYQATEWLTRQWLKVKATEPDSQDKTDLLTGLATLRSVIRHQNEVWGPQHSEL